MLLLLHCQVECLNTQKSNIDVKKYFLLNTISIAFSVVPLLDVRKDHHVELKSGRAA